MFALIRHEQHLAAFLLSQSLIVLTCGDLGGFRAMSSRFLSTIVLRCFSPPERGAFTVAYVDARSFAP
jgi:hypothetical protein